MNAEAEAEAEAAMKKRLIFQNRELDVTGRSNAGRNGSNPGRLLDGFLDRFGPFKGLYKHNDVIYS